MRVSAPPDTCRQVVHDGTQRRGWVERALQPQHITDIDCKHIIICMVPILLNDTSS